jgi:hypothetical protein
MQEMNHIEDYVLMWLQKRQNMRRFGAPAVTYQDCMDLMFFLAKRLKRLEEVISPESIRKVIRDDIRSNGTSREVVKKC